MTNAIGSKIERYLRTGETDPHHAAWTGDRFMDRARRASDDLRGALVAAVSRRSTGAVVRELPEPEALVGLPFTRRREWLLDIAYPERATFAYACEAFSRVLERARRPSDRLELAHAFGRQFRPGDDRVDADEEADIVCDAAEAR